MKVVFDIDGTLTNFNEFLEKHAYNYFIKKYGFMVKYPNKLELEDIFDIKNTLIERYGYDQKKAEIEMKKILDEFWVGMNFLKFSIFGKFRKGASEVLNKFKKSGVNIKIVSSRSKTTENNLVGSIAREFTYMQFLNNGIKLNKEDFYFCENDEQKIEIIKNFGPNIVFEDKPEIINELSKTSKVICIPGTHNTSIKDSNDVSIMKDYSVEYTNEKMKELLGENAYNYLMEEADSNKYFKKLEKLGPIIMNHFNPIILHEESLIPEGNYSTIYAPNHRSTWDPVIIEAYLKRNIHWAALLRFFKKEDSIFNNSKNPILCDATSYFFEKLRYFPIDRKSDNPNANNYESLKRMKNFLNINSDIGIFAEGTTRRPLGADFGTFDDAFLLLAKKTDSWVQPITTLWIDEKDIENKVIINIGDPFKVGNMSKEEALKKFLIIQENSLEENKKFLEEIKKSNIKKLKIKKM